MEKRSPKVKEASVSQDNPDRAERLAKALRDNLKRRKQQARARSQQHRPNTDSPHDSAGFVPDKPRG